MVQDDPRQPIATYYGLYNTLTVEEVEPGSEPVHVTGNLTILKHSSL